MNAALFSKGDLIAGRYRIERYIGQGGMGAIYEAVDTSFDERVVVKTILPNDMGDADLLARFKREARIGHRISHPNVCHTHDMGYHSVELEDGGRRDVIFLTMPFFEGETLAVHLDGRDGPMSVTEAFPLALQMAEGLAAIHDAEAVHRDFKGSNVMLVKDGEQLRPVILDFGVARLTGTDSPDAETDVKVTAPGQFPGTPVYMAPEQFSEDPVTYSADVYAFGVVMYEVLTGHLPLTASSYLALIRKKDNESPPPPETHVPSLRGPWSAFLLRCLDKDPRKRFPTARDMLEALPGRRPRVRRVQTEVPAAPPVTAPTIVGLEPLTHLLDHGYQAVLVCGPTASGKSELVAGYIRAAHRFRGTANIMTRPPSDSLVMGGTMPGEIWYQPTVGRRVFVDPAGEFFTLLSPRFRSRLRLPDLRGNLRDKEFDFLRPSVRRLAGIILTFDLTRGLEGDFAMPWRDQEEDVAFLIAALRWLRFDRTDAIPELSLETTIAAGVSRLPRIDVPIMVTFTKADLLSYTHERPVDFARRHLPMLHGALKTHARRYRYDFCHTMTRTEHGDRPTASPCGVLLPIEWLLNPPLSWVPRLATREVAQ